MPQAAGEEERDRVVAEIAAILQEARVPHMVGLPPADIFVLGRHSILVHAPGQSFFEHLAARARCRKLDLPFKVVRTKCWPSCKTLKRFLVSLMAFEAEPCL